MAKRRGAWRRISTACEARDAQPRNRVRPAITCSRNPDCHAIKPAVRWELFRTADSLKNRTQRCRRDIVDGSPDLASRRLTVRSIYLDLFDDNLYEFTAEGPRQPEDLHAVLSVQVLLSILFRRRIAVPEQWLCSSRAFVLLAKDVIRAWHGANGFAQQRGHGAPPFPFSFSYFPRDVSGTEFLAAQAIRERVLRQRPLRLAQALSLETPEERRMPARQGLQDALTEALSDSFPNFGGAFVDKVERATGDSTIAEALGSILGRIASARPPQTIRSLDNYNKELSAAVRSVRNALRMEALRELEDPRTDGFIKFFNEVRDRKIPLHDITGMWGVTRT